MQVIRVADVAFRCSVTPQTVYRWAKEDPTFPQPFKIGSITVWDEADVNKWLESHKNKESNHGSEREEGHQRTDIRPADTPA